MTTSRRRVERVPMEPIASRRRVERVPMETVVEADRAAVDRIRAWRIPMRTLRVTTAPTTAETAGTEDITIDRGRSSSVRVTRSVAYARADTPPGWGVLGRHLGSDSSPGGSETEEEEAGTGVSNVVDDRPPPDEPSGFEGADDACDVCGCADCGH